MAAVLAMMVMFMLTNALVTFAGGNGRTALFRSGMLAVAFLFIAVFLMLFFVLNGDGRGGLSMASEPVLAGGAW